MIEIFVRHGESDRHTGRLTDEGERQARIAGDYIRKHFPASFKIGITSPSTRARHTARLLGFTDISWQIDERIREMSLGATGAPPNFAELEATSEYRSLDWHKEPDGEVWRDVLDRVGDACDDISARYGSKNRIISTHGNALHTIRMHKERVQADSFHSLFEGSHRYYLNCQLIIYSDIDPSDAQCKPGHLWVMSACPWSDKQLGHDWIRVY